LRNLLAEAVLENLESIVTDKVSAICQQLAEQLGGASVAYERQNGTHAFIILYEGTRFSVQFQEQWLRRKSRDDLEEAVRSMVERVFCNTSTTRIRFGT
jgi:hypothetical protein